MIRPETVLHRHTEIDNLILNRLSDEGTAINDLIMTGIRLGTARASLKRLLDAKAVRRRWHGNERFGRFVYFASET